MKRYILTGAPGAGKTSIIRALAAAGHVVVEEAATDIIAIEHARGNLEPHTDPAFIEAITALQIERQTTAPASTSGLQFFDRSPICTQALSVFLGYPVPPSLAREAERMAAESVYERRVFFIANLGFVEPTAARRISFEDSLAFEKVHASTYKALGYACVRIPAAPVADRVAPIEAHVRAWA